MNLWLSALLSLSVTAANFQNAQGRVATAPAFVSVPLRNVFPGVKRTPLTNKLCPECDTEKEKQSRPILGGSNNIFRNFPQLHRHHRCDAVWKQNSLLELNDLAPSLEMTDVVTFAESLPELNEVKVSLLQSDNGESTKNLPLVVTPRENTSLDFLSTFLEENRARFDKMILQYGAVLFRGFDIKSAIDVEKAVMSYQPKLNNNYRGTSPRVTQDGSDYVFSAAEVPSNYPIAQHIEMSFLPALPRQLYFSALKAPKTIGGETALADFRKVYQDIPLALREKLATKKLRYHRTHKKVGSRFTYDVADMLGWPHMFGTSDKSEVERLAKEEGMPMRWEGETFVSEYESEPFQLHPETNEPVWFNHAQVFHWTTFAAELFFAFRRTREWRLLLQALKVSVFSIIKYGLLKHKMALDVSFGDGNPISVKEMSQIRHAIQKNMVFNRWQQGDILMIDNFSTSHGRQPTYDKGRKVVVAWSDPIEKSNKSVLSGSLVATTTETEASWQ